LQPLHLFTGRFFRFTSKQEPHRFFVGIHRDFAMHSMSRLACAFLLTSFATPAFAAAPSQAMNKTITVAFTATGTSKAPDGIVRSFNTQVTRMIYVSSAGRLFMRHEARRGSMSRGGDFDPSDTRRGKGSFNFQGNKLVGVIPYDAGARQITVTFDPGFSSCTANVIEGHSGGVIRRMGPSGKMYEITRGTTTAPSCSIQTGNAFAGR
jgi:hypothetical protein